MSNRICNILQNLERVRENMLALSDDIWLSIDHKNPAHKQTGQAAHGDSSLRKYF